MYNVLAPSHTFKSKIKLFAYNGHYVHPIGYIVIQSNLKGSDYSIEYQMNTSFGRYGYFRLPFELKNTYAIFQQKIDEHFVGMSLWMTYKCTTGRHKNITELDKGARKVQKRRHNDE